MKSDRLLSAVLLLQAHGRLTARELAEKLEVSIRTAHRDMEALSAAGVPVYALRGVQGGWQLDENWRTEVPALDDAELRALLAAQGQTFGDAGMAAAGERAMSKLLAALPEPVRGRAAAIRQRLYVDPTGWRQLGEDLSALAVVQDALSRDRKLRFVYRDAGGAERERVVDPLGLVAKGTSWYLFAKTAAGLRTYRISRISGAEMLAQASERPARFDLAEAWRESTAAFARGQGGLMAVLAVREKTAEELRTWTPVETVGEGARGWVRLRIRFDSEDHAVFVVLGLGARARVVEPESLRRRVRREVRAAFRRICV